MSAEEEASGIPTRAIHESYLDMQRALKEYRRATDRGSQHARDRAHGELQDAVLTLYEMLRPHLRENSSVSDYWEGAPPSYPGDNGTVPDPADGTAILSWQVHPRSVDLNGSDPPKNGSLRAWHDALDLPESVRVQQVYPVSDDGYMVRYQAYEMGLAHLDDWQTQFRTVQTEIGGFMGARPSERQVRQRVPIEKLRRAARALADAANMLGFLSHTETPVISDPDPI